MRIAVKRCAQGFKVERDAQSASSSSLRFFQITRVEPFSEPPVNRSKQFARLLRLALVTPEAFKAHGGAVFERLCPPAYV